MLTGEALTMASVTGSKALMVAAIAVAFAAPEVRDIFERFSLSTQIDKLAKSGLLYLESSALARSVRIALCLRLLELVSQLCDGGVTETSSFEILMFHSNA
jgi:hypothetical protein